MPPSEMQRPVEQVPCHRQPLPQVACERIEQEPLNPANPDLEEEDDFVSKPNFNQPNKRKEPITFELAVKGFLNGLISPITSLTNPKTLLLLGLGGLLATFLPVTLPLMFIAGALYSGYLCGAGINNAITCASNGDSEGFKKAFENIGAGCAGFVLTGITSGASANIVRCAKANLKLPFSPKGVINNLKEISSLITTGPGLRVLINGFSPLSIGKHITSVFSNWSNLLKMISLSSVSFSWTSKISFVGAQLNKSMPVWNQPANFSSVEQVF